MRFVTGGLCSHSCITSSSCDEASLHCSFSLASKSGSYTSWPAISLAFHQQFRIKASFNTKGLNDHVNVMLRQINCGQFLLVLWLIIIISNGERSGCCSLSCGAFSVQYSLNKPTVWMQAAYGYFMKRDYRHITIISARCPNPFLAAVCSFLAFLNQW